jgi:SRSO17 transposase
MQALLAEHAWDWKAALKALQQFIVADLGDVEAVVVLDETAELKKGAMTVGVARQYAGITGQVENCQTVVFAAYVTGCAHALFDFRLYLPKSWYADRARRKQARVPDEVEFATKPALGTEMITGAASAGVPVAWVAADEVYGRSSKLREACEKDVKGYVFAVPVNFTVTLPSGRKSPVAAVARLIPATAWETRSCGRGCKGHRSYAWAWAATASPRHWVLTRRSQSDPSDLAFFYCVTSSNLLMRLFLLSGLKLSPASPRTGPGNQPACGAVARSLRPAALWRSRRCPQPPCQRSLQPRT